jgi:repressor LexA
VQNTAEARRNVGLDQPQHSSGVDSSQSASGSESDLGVLVPLVGRIRAGEPTCAEQLIEETFPLPRHLVGRGTLFLLKVAGDSMIEAAIADGDWVVVRQQRTAENGEIVAAMIDGEATVNIRHVLGRLQHQLSGALRPVG